MRDASISIRALSVQRDLIDLAAAKVGKSRSDFILEAACERAQNVILDQVLFQLDSQAFKSLVELLDEAEMPSPGLRRLMAVEPPWSTTTEWS